MSGKILFISGSDPLVGLAKASDHLGLKYGMFVTSDKERFLKAARYLISRNLPVILPLREAAGYEREAGLLMSSYAR